MHYVKMGENETCVPYKRKRKRTFLQQQTRFYKQGRYGKGARLDQDVYEYFLRILEVMKHDQNKDSNERGILADNVFEEIQGQETDYSFNQLASRVIEELLPHSSSKYFSTFLKAFRENPRPILGDPYASHVLEKLFTDTLTRLFSPNVENEQAREDYTQFLINMSRFLLNNLEDLVWDTYAIHVVETSLHSLTGNIYCKEKDSFASVVPIDKTLPDQFGSLINEFTNRLLCWPQFADLVRKDVTSVLIQSLLFVNSNNKKVCKKIIKKILKQNFEAESDNENLKPEMDNPASIRVLEKCILVASEKTLNSIFENCFKTHLRELSLNKTSNFAVQKIIKNSKSRELFEEMFAELGEHFEDILHTGHSGVIFALAETCGRLKTKQGEFIKMLSKALHCYEPEERNLKLVPLTLSLIQYEKYQEQDSKIQLHGSLMVQELLKYNKPIKIINSILNMNTEHIINVISDPRGSHICDALFKSSFVGEKSREKLIRKLQGHYIDLAKSKHGSRSLDTVWSMCGIKQKIAIMNELKAKQSDLMSSQFGKGVSFRFQLDHFRHSKDDWIKTESKKTVKEKLFSEITGK